MDGRLSAQMATVDALKRVLETEGIVFTPGDGYGPGVALRRDPPPAIRKRKRRGEA